MSSASGRFWRLLILLVAGGLLVLLLRDLEPSRLIAAFQRADWRLLIIAVLLNLTVNLWARVKRWQVSIEPLPATGPPAGPWELTSILLASYAASNLLPARPGEVLRVVHLHRRCGYPLGALVAARFFEKVVETISLGLLAIPAVLLGELPPAAAVTMSLFAALAGGGMIAIFVIARRGGKLPGGAPDAAGVPRGLSLAALRLRLRSFLRKLAAATHLLNSPRTWTFSLSWSCLSDLADVLMVGLCATAVGIEAGFGTWVVVLLAINLAIAAPSTPGQIGVVEAAAVLALGAAGVDPADSLAFAVLYHAVHLLPVTLLGLFGLRQFWAERAGG